MKKLLLFSTLFLLVISSQAQISQENVSRILKTLSSDAMKGRQAFSPEIQKAADFISSEFSKIGLQPLEKENDYLQKFSMQSISIRDAQIKVDGNTIRSDNYFVLTNAEDISWSDADNITLKQIKPADNFRNAFNKYNALEKDLIVFVDGSHSRIFHQFRPYFTRPNRSFSDKKGFNKVFILAEETETFHIELTKNVRELVLTNVVGKIEGNRRDEIIVFSAHYDHLGILEPVAGDSIANGANDNASGTTAVIELARHFAQKVRPERTLIFVGFTAEEVGGYGSQYFSRQLNPDNIVAMFNIEMIGKPATDGPNSAWITGFEKSSFGRLLRKSTKGTGYTFYANPYPNQNLFYRSDNATLARLGVPAHTISTTPIDVDEDYHKVTDEIDTINLSHLTNTIEAIAKAAEGIIAGTDTPTRVEKDNVN